MGGFNFRLGTYNVPSGSSAKSLTKEAEGRASAKREFDGTDGTDGEQKCILKIFKLFGHIELVYVYLCRK